MSERIEPRISVAVTSYNYAEFVGAALDSVFAQSRPACELIVVDDGSQDDSRTVIEQRLADAPIPVEAVFQENQGQAAAFNAAFERMHGDAVAFLDSDDYWLPERLEQVAAFMRQAPGAAVYQHALDTTNGTKRGGLVSADVFRAWREWDGGVFNVADDKSGLLIAPFMPTSALTFPMAVLDRVFPVPENLTTCPDAFLTRAAAAWGPLVSIPVTLGVWRDHGRNAGASWRTDFLAFWVEQVLPALNAYYARHGLDLELVYAPAAASWESAARMLGEWPDCAANGSARRYFETHGAYPPASPTHAAANLLRAILPEKSVAALRRVFRAALPRRRTRL